MPIPDYQTIMLPLLKFLSSKTERSLKECVEEISKVFNLTDSERKTLLPSGNQSVIHNRTGWAKTYLSKAGLVQSTRRGYIIISERGLSVLNSKLAKIDHKVLMQFPEYVAFKKKTNSKDGNDQEGEDIETTETPEELIEKAHLQLKQELAGEILMKIKSCTPEFFERVVIDLLLKMGYGGSRKDAGRAIGKSGDEGIDGVISEDKLGLDNLYVQAKRWDNSVGRPEIQKFVGALTGQRSKKGIFITTSFFTKDSNDFVQKIETKVVLIDGQMLANLMVDYNVGVSTISSFEIKKMDSDYFLDD